MTDSKWMFKFQYVKVKIANSHAQDLSPLQLSGPSRGTLVNEV